ncbi:hypothetical protein [Thermus antranikianii]
MKKIRIRVTTPFFLLMSLSLLTISQLGRFFENREVAVGFGVAAMGFAWGAIVWLENKNLLSFPTLFASFFIAYVGGPTLEALLVDYREFQGIIGLVIQNPEFPLEEITLLGSTGLLAFAFGLWMRYALINGLVRKNKNSSINPPVLNRFVGIHSIFYWVGILVFLSGWVLMLLDTARVGGLQTLLTPRIERLYSLATTRGSLPAAPLVFAGLALAVTGWALGKQRLIRGLLLGFPIFVWVAYLFIQGDRRFVLYTLLVTAGILHTFRGVTFRLSRTSFIVLFALYVFVSFFGATRWLVPPLLQGTVSLGEALRWVSENISWSWFTPSSSEFMGPYTTLVVSLTDPTWWSAAQAPLGGFSYLFSIPNLLPRGLYPGEKWQTLSFQFSDYVYANYLAPYFAAPVGFGLSPLAEAVLNFGRGFWAPLPLFFVLGWVSGYLEFLARKKPVPWGIFYALLLPQAFNLNRTDLAWSFQEAVYYLMAGLAILAIILLLLRSRKGRKPYNVRS